MKKIIVIVTASITMLSLVASDSPRTNYGIDPITGNHISADVAELINSLKTTLWTQKTDRLKAYKAAIKTDDSNALLDYDRSSVGHLINVIESAIKNKIVHSDNAIHNISLFETFLSEYERYNNKDLYFVNLIKNALNRLHSFSGLYNVEGLIEKLKTTLVIPRSERLQAYKEKNPGASHAKAEEEDKKIIDNQINAIATAIYDKIAYHDFDRAAADIKLLETFNGKAYDSYSFLLLTTTIARLNKNLNDEKKVDPASKQKKRFSLFS